MFPMSVLGLTWEIGARFSLLKTLKKFARISKLDVSLKNPGRPIVFVKLRSTVK